MKQVLILLAGYPGTGKTYMCNKILEQEPDFVVVSRDDIKEQLFDKYGFDNLDEKKRSKNWAGSSTMKPWKKV